MWDVHIAEVAGGQFNRVSRQQLLEVGMAETAIDRRLADGRLVAREDGVFGVPPVLEHDPWGTWMEATLTHPGTRLSHISAAAAYGLWGLPRPCETVTRPGSGGPRRIGGLLVHRSLTLDGDCTELRGVPITTPARTLLDLAASRRISDRALARVLREAVRLGRTSLPAIGDALGRHRGRRGTRRIAEAVARYSGLPLGRARSGAEIRALEVLRDAGRPLPRLNYDVADEEADLSWPGHRRIIEIDGGPFHLDAGEDARKQGIWEAAGWTVLRIPSDDVARRPDRLLALAPPA